MIRLMQLLGELTDNFDSIRIPVKQADRRPGPYPYYGASGIVDHIDGWLFNGEYLLIAEDGENLRTRNTPIAFLAKGKFWVNNHVHIVRGNRNTNTRYLLYALSELDISGYLTGSTMPKLTQENLNQISLHAPPLREQQAIAHILGTLDNKIELNRQMNQTLERIARTLFKSWFVDFDPVRAKINDQKPYLSKNLWSLFPDKLIDSKLGFIPEGWEVKQLGDVTKIVGGSTPNTNMKEYWDKGIHCWATPKDLSILSSPVLLDTERKITDAGLRKISSGLLPPGTLLLSSRAPIGYLAISEMPIAINQGFIAMPQCNNVSNLFLLFWCQVFHENILNYANGSTFLEISKTNFRSIPLVVPNMAVLTAFKHLTDPWYKRIVMNEYESRSLVTQRDILLPKLVSGEIQLSNYGLQMKGVT